MNRASWPAWGGIGAVLGIVAGYVAYRLGQAPPPPRTDGGLYFGVPPPDTLSVWLDSNLNEAGVWALMGGVVGALLSVALRRTGTRSVP
jgi:hypothetical protein